MNKSNNQDVRPVGKEATKAPSSHSSQAQSVTPKADGATVRPIRAKRRSGFRPDKLARQTRRKLDKTTAHIVKHGKKFIVERWDHIRMARRNVVLWLVLMLALIIGSFVQVIYYNNQDITVAATNGGTYAEGTTDKLTTISPLYATTNTEKAASQLVYLPLLSYDEANKLRGNLAESWSHDDTGKVWTVKLKPSLTWTDGEALNADDIVYTVKLMQDPDINSTLASSWSGIKATKIDDLTAAFTLSSPLMAFDTSLTFGILPEHILNNKTAIEIARLFSEQPESIVGSGPFMLNGIETTGDNSIWHFGPNDHYYGATPKLDELSIRTYSDNQTMMAGLERGEINAVSNANTQDIAEVDTNKFKVVQLKTADGVFAIFNNSGELTSDQTIRNALRLALNRDAIRNGGISSDGNIQPPTDLETPIATGVYDSIDQLKQPDYNAEQAKAELEQAGWTLSEGAKYRAKNGQELTIRIVTIASTNYQDVAQMIANQWKEIGVNTTVEAVDATQAQQGYLVPRNYDVLVYQLHLGADPDMFAYWSSTQATPTGLNLANYSSRRAEIALANGRTNPNPSARESRYIAFVDQWLQDNPAIALYQPSFFYVMDKNINSLSTGGSLIDASNRFQNVSNWTVNTTSVMATP